MKPPWTIWRATRWGDTCRMLWRIGFTLLFAIWWGGLTFYAAVVVPIGTRLYGSLDQGFVTQEVTRWHNGLLVATIVCLTIEACRGCRRLWWLVAALTLVAFLLIGKHVQLTGLMDFSVRAVGDNFYAHHATYLWLTTIEWILGLVIAAWLTKRRGI